MGENQRQALLNALKLELKFCEMGGYKPVRGRLPVRAAESDPMSMDLLDRGIQRSRKELSVFRDSPSCLNYGLASREHPCAECWLMHYVPTEKRSEGVPCHHIPLNEHGDTVATLGEPSDASHVQEAVIDWLRRTIQQLEETPAQSQRPAA